MRRALRCIIVQRFENVSCKVIIEIRRRNALAQRGRSVLGNGERRRFAGSGPRGAAPLGGYHQQVTLYNIIRFGYLLTQPRPALLPRTLFTHTIAADGIVAELVRV